MIWLLDIYRDGLIGFVWCHVHCSYMANTCRRYLVSRVAGNGMQSRFRLLAILSYTCINHVCLCESRCASRSGTPVHCSYWLVSLMGTYLGLAGTFPPTVRTYFNTGVGAVLHPWILLSSRIFIVRPSNFRDCANCEWHNK